MNKGDLVAAVAASAGTTKVNADKAVEAVFSAIEAALKTGEEVRLVGFGSFSVAQRAAKQGRNPRTGAIVQIAAAKAPKFSAGKALKDAVNG